MIFNFDESFLYISLINLVLNLIFLVLYWRLIGFKPLEPATWYISFHMLLFVLRPIFVYANGYANIFTYMKIYPDLGDTAMAYFASNLGLLAFVAGSLFRGGAQYAPSLHSRVVVTKASLKTFWLAFFLTAPFFLGSFAYALLHPLTENVNSADSILQTDSETGAKIFSNGSAYFYVFRNCIPGIILGLINLFRFRVYLILLAIIYLYFIFLEGRGRFQMIYFILSASIILFTNPDISVTKKRLLGVGGGMLAVTLLAIGGIYRHAFRSGEHFSLSSISISDILNRTPFGDSLEYGMHEFLLYIVKFIPDHNFGFTYFTQYLELFTRWIPRSIWPGKPTGSPIELINLDSFGNFATLTQGLVGAGWLSLGPLGVAILCFGTGYVMQASYVYAAKNWLRPDIRTFYIIALPYSLQWFRDGTPNILEFLIFTLYPIFLWRALMTLLVREARSPFPVKPPQEYGPS